MELMKFFIVKKRWYHSLLEKISPNFYRQDIVPQFQIHLSIAIGKKNGKWCLADQRYYEFEINSTATRPPFVVGSLMDEAWTPPEYQRNDMQFHRDNMLQKLEAKFQKIQIEEEESDPNKQ